MSVLGIGVDLVECARIQHSIDRFGDRFLHRVFTDGEIEYSMSMKFPARHLAARFAAKEAVSKAFGTGIGKAMGWRNIDVQKRPSGEPFLVFSGPAQELAVERGVTSALITLSHTEHHAMASVSSKVQHLSLGSQHTSVSFFETFRKSGSLSRFAAAATTFHSHRICHHRSHSSGRDRDWRFRSSRRGAQAARDDSCRASTSCLEELCVETVRQRQ